MAAAAQMLEHATMRIAELGMGLLALGFLGCGQAASPAQDQDGVTRDAAPPPTGADSASPADAGPDQGPGRDATGSDRDSAAPALDATTDTSAPPLDGGGQACGTRTTMHGLTSRTLMVGGLQRTYLIYLPQSLDPTTPVPFVFVFHGYTMSGQDMHDITQYSLLADQEGFGLAFPDGEGGAGSLANPWNVENAGQTVCGVGQFASASGDDFAFVDAMKADVLTDQCLDAAHVYATGFSMGGYFTHHMACYRSDIRAAAPHSGGTLADLSSCTTGHVPMIIFHGTSDSVISDGCDDPFAAAVSGFPPSATLWAARNGCQTTYTTVPETGDAGGAGQCYLYDGCPADGQVELCTFNGMDHCWAGGDPNGSGGSSACPTYASATALQWAFFKQYAW